MKTSMTQVQEMGVQLHRPEMTAHRVSEKSHAIRHYKHPVPVQVLTNCNELNLEYPSSAYLAKKKHETKAQLGTLNMKDDLASD